MLGEIFGVDAVVVLVVVLGVLVGGTQIPKLARSLGSARGEFQKGIDESRRTAPSDEADPVDVG